MVLLGSFVALHSGAAGARFACAPSSLSPVRFFAAAWRRVLLRRATSKRRPAKAGLCWEDRRGRERTVSTISLVSMPWTAARAAHYRDRLDVVPCFRHERHTRRSIAPDVEIRLIPPQRRGHRQLAGAEPAQRHREEHPDHQELQAAGARDEAAGDRHVGDWPVDERPRELLHRESGFNVPDEIFLRPTYKATAIDIVAPRSECDQRRRARRLG